mgnify:CR=1 FL=1
MRASGVVDPPFALIAKGAIAVIMQNHAANVLIAHTSKDALSAIGPLTWRCVRAAWTANISYIARTALTAPIVLVVWD